MPSQSCSTSTAIASGATATANITYSGVLSGQLVNAVSRCNPGTGGGSQSQIWVDGDLNGTPWALLMGSYDGQTGVYDVISGQAGGGTGMTGPGYSAYGNFPTPVAGVSQVDWAHGATLDVQLTSQGNQTPAGNLEVRGTITCG